MKLIAHRGASAHYPENTLAAFRGALESGCSAVECDVQQTKDGVLILSHDGHLGRTAAVQKSFRELSYGELAEFDVGSWFDKRFAKERVPKFEQLLEFLPQAVELHVDIKQVDPPCERLEERILNAVESRELWRERTTFASKDAGSLERLRKIDLELRLGFQPSETPINDAFKTAKRLQVESLRLNKDRVTPEWIERSHQEGWEVYVYAVSEPQDLERLVAMGVDCIFTGDPGLGVR